MRQGELFALPERFVTRVEELKDSGLSPSLAALLLQVELGFALMEYLNLQDEPVVAVWAILSGMPMRHPRLQLLTDEQRRAIANARQIIPDSARFAWLNAVRSYICDIDIDLRNYKLDRSCLDTLEDRIIHAAKSNPITHPANQAVYDHCLSCQLSFDVHNYKTVKAKTAYRFEARTEKETTFTSVSFSDNHLAAAPSLPSPWLEATCNKSLFSFNIEDLLEEATYLDEREEDLSQRFSWKDADKGRWVKRFRKISFHKVNEAGELGDRNTEPVTIDGFTHLAGMVAAGKTTLSTLLAVHILRKHPDRRLTIVVGDVQFAIRLANQINGWFCDSPERDSPVAVPLLGRSGRDTHLKAFYASQDYQTYLSREQPHWGDRWLGTACPLQVLLEPTVLRDQLDGRPLTPGTEPCHSLKKLSPPLGEPASFHLCPFFAKCPSQQTYFDMPSARVWITTAGGMAMGGLPRHLDLRRIKLGELVYEHSSVVIFDEVDTIIKWFDDVYAETVTLANGKDGVFDTINIKTERYTTLKRVRPPLTVKWTTAERHAQTIITATLISLNQGSARKLLRQWTQRGYFTPNTLFYKLARRMAGLEELDVSGLSEEKREQNEAAVEKIVQHFHTLLEKRNPLRDRLSADPKGDPVDGLTSLMQNINTTGESATNFDIHRACKGWINRFFPETKQRLKMLQEELSFRLISPRRRRRSQSSDDNKVDTIEELAYRLQFALTITLLDLHTRSVFYQWQHRPYEIDDDPPHRRMPAGMLNVLPLPLTGRQFGTYYSQHGEDNSSFDDSDPLSMFAYTNIGRWYVLNFHRLLTDFDGKKGPNVLALSGTSYLPDSTQFHVGTQKEKPYGVLMPDDSAKAAIADSLFEFSPQYDAENVPIRFSGRKETEKPKLLKEMVRSLTGNDGRGHLGQTLKELKRLGQSEPERWADRDRILLLVNSYEQSLWAAQSMRNCWTSLKGEIYHLVSSNGREDPYQNQAFADTQSGALSRNDIESFGQTNGKILIAPISAIGRGFNILNDSGKAAFGTVYFLTRPYPHPHDTQRIAQELNRRALDWQADPDFVAWEEDGIQKRAEAVRQCATRYWRLAEYRSYYSTLRSDEELRANPRRDLAATTAGVLIQAVGRLIRGGVPFHAYFVDAAWAANFARDQTPETPETSLLAAIIDLLEDYVNEDPICQALYGPLADAIAAIENFERKPNKHS